VSTELGRQKFVLSEMMSAYVIDRKSVRRGFLCVHPGHEESNSAYKTTLRDVFHLPKTLPKELTIVVYSSPRDDDSWVPNGHQVVIGWDCTLANSYVFVEGEPIQFMPAMELLARHFIAATQKTTYVELEYEDEKK